MKVLTEKLKCCETTIDNLQLSLQNIHTTSKVNGNTRQSSSKVCKSQSMDNRAHSPKSAQITKSQMESGSRSDAATMHPEHSTVSHDAAISMPDHGSTEKVKNNVHVNTNIPDSDHVEAVGFRAPPDMAQSPVAAYPGADVSNPAMLEPHTVSVHDNCHTQYAQYTGQSNSAHQTTTNTDNPADTQWYSF